MDRFSDLTVTGFVTASRILCSVCSGEFIVIEMNIILV